MSEKAGAQTGPGFLPAEARSADHQIPAAPQGSLSAAVFHCTPAARLTRVSAVCDRRRCWSTVRAARGLTTCRRRSPQSWASWRPSTTPCTWSLSRDTRWGVQCPSLMLVCDKNHSELKSKSTAFPVLCISYLLTYYYMLDFETLRLLEFRTKVAKVLQLSKKKKNQSMLIANISIFCWNATLDCVSQENKNKKIKTRRLDLWLQYYFLTSVYKTSLVPFYCLIHWRLRRMCRTTTSSGEIGNVL